MREQGITEKTNMPENINSPFEEGDLELDTRIFTPEVLQLLEDYDFSIRTIPSRDKFEINSTATSIALDLWYKGYAFENEELNRIVLIKTNPKFTKPGLSISFCLLDSYREFERTEDIELWSALFLENGEKELTKESQKFGRFLGQYILLLNELKCEVFLLGSDAKRKERYQKFITRLPHPTLVKVS